MEHSKITTIIHSNGSKWAGQEPDEIDTLINRLDNEILDVDMFRYFYQILPNGCFLFFGNFITYSHVFRIETDDPEIYMPLALAIGKNLNRITNEVCEL